MRKALTGIELMTGLALLAPALASGQSAGRYRIWLCAEPCTPADSLTAVGSATIVILDDSTAESEPMGAALASAHCTDAVAQPAVSP